MKNPKKMLIVTTATGVATITAVIIYAARLPARPASTPAPPSSSSVPAALPRAGDIATTLADALAASAPFERLTETQQAWIVRQTANLFTVYLEADGPESIVEIMRRWGVDYRSKSDAETHAKRWAPPGSPDRIVTFDAAAAILESKADQIVGERDGAPVWQTPRRLAGSDAAELRTSPFFENGRNDPAANADDPYAIFSSYAVVVPAQYANGDRAVIAFWFRWSDKKQRWLPSLLQFERENRPFMGAPLF